jgi:hypothetical protein
MAVVWASLAIVAVPVILLQNNSFMRGFSTAAFLAAAAFFPFYAVAFNGLYSREMGADAEEWTSEAFRALDRRQWFVLDDLMFDRGNVDHVVVGPGRHVFVVESKWCSFGQRPERWLASWLRQTQRGAKNIRLLLKSGKVNRQVTPVLIIWGPRHSIDGHYFVERDGVLVATGRGVDALLTEIRRRSPGVELDYPACRVLEDFGTRQDAATAKAISA